MSRTIKFRAWDGWIMHRVGQLNWSFRNGITIVQAGNRPWSSNKPWRRITNPVLMQYTGLKDKNGKEIYEGDIVRDSRIEESEAVIEYCQPIAAFVARPIIKAPYDVYQLNEGNTMGSLKLSYTEVIGNIYENPDLLKGEPNE